MQESVVNYRGMRALIALSNKQISEYVWHFLKDMGADQVNLALNSRDAIARLSQTNYTHYFVGYHFEDLGGPGLTQFIRMRDGKAAEVPVIMIMSNASPEKVRESRDVGVNEIMVLPITGKAIGQRLLHVTKQDKEFIRGNSYIGPCRRRVSAKPYEGEERRGVAEKVRRRA